jgi:predicted esterase
MPSKICPVARARGTARKRGEARRAALLGALLLSACWAGAARAQPEAARSEPASPAALGAPAGLAADGTRALEVPRFLPAVVSFPKSDSWPQPTLVAAHGAGETPEMHCALWRSIVGDRGVIVCPRGQPMKQGRDDGFFYPTHFALEREVTAALKALAERYPKHADTAPATYAGFSQGANMGALMLVERGRELPRIFLLEGGSGDMNPTRGKRFKKTGGKAAAIVCGRPKCASQARRNAEHMRKLGLQADAYYVEGAGHSNFDMMFPTLKQAWLRLIKDDPRWL